MAIDQRRKDRLEADGVKINSNVLCCRCGSNKYRSASASETDPAVTKIEGTRIRRSIRLRCAEGLKEGIGFVLIEVNEGNEGNVGRSEEEEENDRWDRSKKKKTIDGIVRTSEDRHGCNECRLTNKGDRRLDRRRRFELGSLP